MTSQKIAKSQHEMRRIGSLLDDGRLSYSLEQSLDDDNNHNSSLNASYRSPYGTFSAGYSYGNECFANTITALPAAWLSILMA